MEGKFSPALCLQRCTCSRALVSLSAYVQGLAWGMLPLHASSLCAVTYHLFYNAPSLTPLVTLQAGLTFVGNLTLFAAATRLTSRPIDAPPRKVDAAENAWQSDATFLGLSLSGSVASASAVKYGSLFLDPLFSPNLTLALAVVAGGTAVTGAALALRTSQGAPQP